MAKGATTEAIHDSRVTCFGVPQRQVRNYFKYVVCHTQSHYIEVTQGGKVQLFWEGHKNLELSSTWFDIYLVHVKSSGW